MTRLPAGIQPQCFCFAKIDLRGAPISHWEASLPPRVFHTERSHPGFVFVEGWIVNHKRVERIWKPEGLKVPVRQPKRGRLWLNDGSCIRLRPAYRDHVWSYDFMQDRTHNGNAFHILNIMDEYTRECLFTRVERHLTH
jgi:hypothetical protein